MQAYPSLYRHPLLGNKERAAKATIRWMKPYDLLAVLLVEESTDDPWSEQKLTSHLRDRNTIGLVIELRDPTTGHDSTVGHVVYSLDKHRLNLARLVIDRDFRRLGLGTQLIEKLKTKLSTHGKRRVRCLVPESELAIQQLLRASGFRAIEQDNGKYEWDDCYRMEYRHKEPAS